MSGSFDDMGNLLKQAQKMQRALDKVREELRETTVEGTAGGGVVRATVTGDGQVEQIVISEEAMRAGDRRMLEELVLAAVRDGIDRAQRLRHEREAKVTGGLQLPDLL